MRTLIDRRRGRLRGSLLTGMAVAAVTLTGLLAPTLAAAKHSSKTVAKTTQLHGTLRLSPGKFVKATKHVKAHYTGSYFQMILPGATDQYFANVNSRAANKNYTLFRPGKQGGLKLGKYQGPPNPAFATNGNALGKSIVLPEEFAGIYFTISTAATDAQDGQHDPAPSLTLHPGGHLSGNFSAWTAEWNSIYFNQGSPKPDGTFPGFTKPVSGTYNAKTRAFEIVWYSQIVGGPFNGFTGYWHLQGTLKP